MKHSETIAETMILILFCLVLSGCQEKNNEGIVRLVIDSETSVAGAFDEIVVTLTASRTGEGRFCEAVTKSFAVNGGVELPLVVDLIPGSIYTELVAFRVVWLGEGVPVHQRESLAPVPAEGIQEVRVTFEESCLQFSCSPQEQCIAGTCQGMLVPDPFEDQENIDIGEKCVTAVD